MLPSLALLLICSTVISGAPTTDLSEVTTGTGLPNVTTGLPKVTTDFPEVTTNKNDTDSGDDQYWTQGYLCLSKHDAIWWVVTVIAAAILLPWFINCCCGCCGFTSGGVSGGSYASGYQSLAGNVAKGSCFACLQSCTMRGGVTICGPVGNIAAIGAAIGYWFLMHDCVGDSPEPYQFIRNLFG